MTYLYNDLFYGCNLLDFLFLKFLLHASFEISLFSFYCKFAIYIDNTCDLSFHFYLYNVKEKNTFYFEKFENLSLFFVYCNFVIIIIIPNTCGSLSSLVVRINTEAKFIRKKKKGFI